MQTPAHEKCENYLCEWSIKWLLIPCEKKSRRVREAVEVEGGGGEKRGILKDVLSAIKKSR